MAEKERKNRGQLCKATEEYINNACRAFLEPHGEYLGIECKFTGSEGEGYIKLVDATDHADYYSITDMELEDVCKMIAKIVEGGHITRQVVEHETRKKVAALFR